MKAWKIVSGILSIIFAVIAYNQSVLVGVATALEQSSDTSAGSGMVVAILLVAGGIVSIVTCKGGRGGNIATMILFFLAAMMGFAEKGMYGQGDLQVWSGWALICGIIALLAAIFQKKKKVE